jgi:GNAT superfamily N-acetyltransferase
MHPVTEPPRADRAADHERNTELLVAELPAARYADASYLRWLYDENPLGRTFYANADEDGRRMAHYAVVPQRYRNRDGPQPFVFSLHAVTRSGAQRKGYFSQLGEEIYEQARQWGALGVIGVSNDNSTPPVVKRLGFRLLGPLPVRVVPARRRRPPGFDSYRADAAFLAGDRFAEIAPRLDSAPAQAWTNCWSVDYLRWRLSAPNCGPFSLHVSDDLVALSTTDQAFGQRVAVIVKLIGLQRGTGRISGHPAIEAACAHHGARFAVYAGFNRRVRVLGVQPPRRFQPSPLNLIFRSLSPEVPKAGFVLDTFEFLDMDAY